MENLHHLQLRKLRGFCESIESPKVCVLRVSIEVIVTSVSKLVYFTYLRDISNLLQVDTAPTRWRSVSNTGGNSNIFGSFTPTLGDFAYFSNGLVKNHQLPWEPIPFIFRGYDPYIGGSKPSFFMVLGSKGSNYLYTWNPKQPVFDGWKW